MKASFFFATVLLFASALQINASVSCGEAAPDFTLPEAGSGEVSLSQYSGHYVVLEWFNHNCPFVHKFYNVGTMQKWQEEMTGRGVIWLTIDSTNPTHRDHMDAQEAAKVYDDMHLHSTALLLDETGTVGHLYGATNTPQFFVIDPKGVLIYQGAIDDKRSTNSEDIERAHNYLIQALDEALDGNPVSKPVTRPYGCSVKYAD